MVIVFLILAVTTSQGLPICSTYCKALLSGISVKWRSDCECSYTSLMLDQNDTNIYYKPANVNVKSKYSPPVQRQFFIPNPILNTNKIQTPNLKERVLRHGKSTPRMFSNSRRFLPRSPNRHPNKNSSYFDVDSIIKFKMNNSSNYPTNNIDDFKNNLIECVELHIFNHTRVCNCTDVPSNFKYKHIKDNYKITNDELKTEIAQKCQQITDIVEKSVEDIKGKWRKKNDFNEKNYNVESKFGTEQKTDTEFNTETTLPIKRMKNTDQKSPLFSNASNMPENEYERRTTTSLLKMVKQDDEKTETDSTTILTQLTPASTDNLNYDKLFEYDKRINKNQYENLEERSTTANNEITTESNTVYSPFNTTPQVETEIATENIVEYSPVLVNKQDKSDPDDYRDNMSDAQFKANKLDKNVNVTVILEQNSIEKSVNDTQNDKNVINQFQKNNKLPSKEQKTNTEIETSDEVNTTSTLLNRMHGENNNESTVENSIKFSFQYLNESDINLQENNNNTEGVKEHTKLPVLTYEPQFNDSALSFHRISLNNSDIDQNLPNMHKDNLLKSEEKTIKYSPSVDKYSSFSKGINEENETKQDLPIHNTTKGAHFNVLENNDASNKPEESLIDFQKLIRPINKEVPLMSIVTREYPNGTVLSVINGAEFLPNSDFKDGDTKTNLQIKSVTINNTTRYSEKVYYLDVLQASERENVKTAKEDEAYVNGIRMVNSTITGKLYFMYKNQLIPTQFIQDLDGNINVGINLSSHYNESRNSLINQ